MARADVEAVLEALAVALEDRKAEPAVDRDKAMPIDEAAEWLGVSRMTVYRLMRRGELGSVVIDARRLVLVASINRLIDGSGPAERDSEVRYVPIARTPVVRPIRRCAPQGGEPAAQPAPEQAARARPAAAAGVKRPLRVVSPTESAPATEPGVTLYSIEKTVQLLGCGKGKVRAMLADGRLTPVPVGPRVFVSAAEVSALLSAGS